MTPALDWTNREAAARWLAELKVAIEDMTSAAEDQVQPMAERHLGRAEARRIIADGRVTLEVMLDCAERGLANDSP